MQLNWKAKSAVTSTYYPHIYAPLLFSCSCSTELQPQHTLGNCSLGHALYILYSYLSSQWAKALLQCTVGVVEINILS